MVMHTHTENSRGRLPQAGATRDRARDGKRRRGSAERQRRPRSNSVTRNRVCGLNHAGILYIAFPSVAV